MLSLSLSSLRPQLASRCCVLIATRPCPIECPCSCLQSHLLDCFLSLPARVILPVELCTVRSFGRFPVVVPEIWCAQLYKVRWAGCSEAEDSWEPKSKIAPQLVAAFHTAESQQLGPCAQPEPTSPKRTRQPGSACSPSAGSPASKR